MAGKGAAASRSQQARGRGQLALCALVGPQTHMHGSLLSQGVPAAGTTCRRYHHAVKHIMVRVQPSLPAAEAARQRSMRAPALPASHPTMICLLQGCGGAIGVTIFQLTNIVLITIACWRPLPCRDACRQCTLFRQRAAHRRSLVSPPAQLLSSLSLPSCPHPTPTDTITGALSLKTIATMSCEVGGVAPGDCFNESWKLTLIFSAGEAILSQVGAAQTRRTASRAVR